MNECTRKTKTSQLAAATEELLETKRKLAEEKDTNKSNKKEITYLQKTASSSSIALDLLSESNTKLSITRNAYERTRERLEAEKGRSGRFLKRTKALWSSAYRAKNTKKKEKQSAIDATSDLNGQLTDVKEELTATQNELTDLMEEVSSLDQQLAEKDEELTKARQLVEEQRVEFERALAACTHEISRLNDEIRGLQNTIEHLRFEEDELIGINEELTERVDEYRAERKHIEMRLDRLTESKNKLEDYREFVQSTLQIFNKGAYAPRIRGIIRFMITRGCPLKKAGKILNYIYQNLIKPLLNPSKRPEKIKLEECTVKRFTVEGLVAARLQQFLEIMRSTGTFCSQM